MRNDFRSFLFSDSRFSPDQSKEGTKRSDETKRGG